MLYIFWNICVISHPFRKRYKQTNLYHSVTPYLCKMDILMFIIYHISNIKDKDRHTFVKGYIDDKYVCYVKYISSGFQV